MIQLSPNAYIIGLVGRRILQVVRLGRHSHDEPFGLHFMGPHLGL